MKSLIAINPCIMEGSNTPTLTVGKSYDVVDEYNDELCIRDDENTAHWFEKDTLADFFDIPSDKVDYTLIQLLKGELNEVQMKEAIQSVDPNISLEELEQVCDKLMNGPFFYLRWRNFK